MATKQLVIDIDRRLAGVLSLMAHDDCRTSEQEIAWLIRNEAVRRGLLEKSSTVQTTNREVQPQPRSADQQDASDSSAQAERLIDSRKGNGPEAGS